MQPLPEFERPRVGIRAEFEKKNPACQAVCWWPKYAFSMLAGRGLYDVEALVKIFMTGLPYKGTLHVTGSQDTFRVEQD